MKFCPMCGKPVVDGSDFCMHCGINLNEFTQENKNNNGEIQTAKKVVNNKIIISIGILIILAIGVFLFVFFNRTSNPLPYNVNWEYSYSQVAKKDTGVNESSLNKDGDSYFCLSTKDGTYFDYNAGDLSLGIMYYFGMNDSLEKIVEVVTVEKNGNIDDTKFIKDATDHYNKLCNSTPTVVGGTYTWITKNDNIELTYFSDNFFIITSEPISN